MVAWAALAETVLLLSRQRRFMRIRHFLATAVMAVTVATDISAVTAVMADVAAIREAPAGTRGVLLLAVLVALAVSVKLQTDRMAFKEMAADNIIADLLLRKHIK